MGRENYCEQGPQIWWANSLHNKRSLKNSEMKILFKKIRSTELIKNVAELKSCLCCRLAKLICIVDFFIHKAEFHSLMAKALYLAKRARPDVLLPVSFLSTRAQAHIFDQFISNRFLSLF